LSHWCWHRISRRAVAILLLCSTAHAASSLLTLGQLNHRVFTAPEGAPSDIYALAQAPDGTLWLGGAKGLTRFDGVRFVAYPGPAEESLPSTNVAALLAASDGGLWIAYRPSGLSLLKGGHVTNYGAADGVPEDPVAQIIEGADGSVWAVARSALVHLRGKSWERVASAPAAGAFYGFAIDHAGTLWLAGMTGLSARRQGEAEFREVDQRKYFSQWGNILAIGHDGLIWAASTQGVVYVDGQTQTWRAQPVAGVTTRGGPLMIDEAENLWISDWDILQRAPARGLAQESLKGGAAEAMSLTISGAFKEHVFALLKDRENNIWVGTKGGLHRFSHTNVVRNIAPPCTEDLATTGPIVAGDDGKLWMACDEGSAFPHVVAIRDGVVLARQNSPPFNVAYRDANGTIWFAGTDVLAHLDEQGHLVTTVVPPPLRGRPIGALVRDRSGAFWLSESRRSTYRLSNGEVSENGGLTGLPQTWTVVETADPDGTLWFGYTHSRLARVSGSTVRMYGAADGLDVGTVIAIYARDGELWVGGELGFARYDGKRFRPVENASGSPLQGVSGIVRDSNGDMWLNAVPGIAHVSRNEIEQVIRDPLHRVNSELFNYLDGVPGSPMKLRPLPSAIETTDGRLWFLMTAGLISIDAAHLARNTLPPPVKIWALNVGSTRFPSLGNTLQLPVHTTALQIDYSAGSLTIPERVRFRYKLEGLDTDWQNVGARREALYTNLGPGRYTFRVTAANNDGMWNTEGASLSFAIAPAFYQTSWFYALCGLLCVAVLGALHLLRTRQVAAEVRARLEVRLSERERIARELHDTLLQGVQGLIWRFQAATDRIPPDAPARALMEQSLDRADQLLGESRDKVKELRPKAREDADLPHTLAQEGEHLSQLHPGRFRISVEGVRRDLHPIVREEGFLIAREALGNAFRHAQAADIEVEVTYRDSALQVRIRDNGHGITSGVLNEDGKPGHFGLRGMRERAKKLGAHLTIWSKPGAGTEVELRVPAQVAYKDRQADSRRRGWRSIFAQSVRKTASDCVSSEPHL